MSPDGSCYKRQFARSVPNWYSFNVHRSQMTLSLYSPIILPFRYSAYILHANSFFLDMHTLPSNFPYLYIYLHQFLAFNKVQKCINQGKITKLFLMHKSWLLIVVISVKSLRGFEAFYAALRILGCTQYYNY